MKKWKRKYKELKELHSQVNQLYLDQCTRTDELIKELESAVALNKQNFPNLFASRGEYDSRFKELKDRPGIKGSDYDIDKNNSVYIESTSKQKEQLKEVRYKAGAFREQYETNPMFKAYIEDQFKATYFNEDKTPNQEVDNTSISSNGQNNLEDFSKAIVKEGRDIRTFSNLPIDPNNPTNLEQFHRAFKFKREETIPNWIIGGLLNGLEVLPITEADSVFEKDQPILHKLL